MCKGVDMRKGARRRDGAHRGTGKEVKHMNTSKTAKDRRRAATVAGVSYQAIYNAERGIKKNSGAWLKNIRQQVSEGRKPCGDEQRCSNCGTIRPHNDYRKKGGNLKKKCKKCESHFINGGNLTWKALDEMKLEGDVYRKFAGASFSYNSGVSHPIVTHIALRRKGVANQQISKILNIPKDRIKYWAKRMGVIDLTTKICAKGYKSSAKFTDRLTITEKEMVWSHETQELRKAERITDWSQHYERKRWHWISEHKNETPRRRELRLKNAERYRRKMGTRSWAEYVSGTKIPKDQLKAREVIRDRTVAAYHRGAKRYLPWLGCTGGQLRSWLESQFNSRMNHDNYGTCWNIDHIIPLSTLDLTDDNQFNMAANFNNLQPMYCRTNSKKGAKTDGQLGFALCIA